MAEWLIEEGIGEHRAIRLTSDGIVEAQVRWPGAQLIAGEIADAKLLEAVGPGGRARVQFPSGEQAFGRKIPKSTSVGAPVRMEVTREGIAERGRFKLAQSLFSSRDVRPAPSLAEALETEGHSVKPVRRFPEEADWDELWLDAANREVAFMGGALLLAETPAMTLVDIDCGRPEEAYFNAIPALARTIRRFDLGGNIGIDFPSLRDRGDRQAADKRLEEYLADWPHERTAMNGFGFVQIVAHLERPSLLHRIARNPSGAAARLLLRRAEALEGAGRIELTAHPAVLASLTEDWLAELRRRTGKELSMRPDPALAQEAPHAQLVPL